MQWQKTFYGRQKLEFFADRKFIGPWTDSIVLSYDNGNTSSRINSSPKTQTNQQNGSVQFQYPSGFFIKLARSRFGYIS